MLQLFGYGVPFLLFSYSGQVLLKRGVNALGGVSASTVLRDPAGTFLAVALNSHFLVGFMLMAVGAMFYLCLLSLGDFSYVLPLLGAIAFLFLPVIGIVFLHEPVSLQRFAGTAIIMVGALIVARG